MNNIIKYETQLDIRQNYDRSTGLLIWHKLITNVCFNDERNEKIVNYVKNHKDDQILIISHIKKHRELLYKLCENTRIKIDRYYDYSLHKDVNHIIMVLPYTNINIISKIPKLTIFVDKNSILHRQYIKLVKNINV